MMPKQEQYWRRKAEEEARYKNKHLEHFFGWWRTPSDRFAGLIMLFTFLLFVATALLWVATQDLVEDAKSSGRAWLGPIGGNIEAPQIDKPIKATVVYNNTGRQPARASLFLGPKVFAKEEWNDGTAVRQLQAARDVCLAGKALELPILLAFPTSGFTNYQHSFDGGRPDTPESERIIADKAIIEGDKIVTFTGCVIYETLGHIHHTSFCYYYRANHTQLNMAYCSVAQAAD